MKYRSYVDIVISLSVKRGLRFDRAFRHFFRPFFVRANLGLDRYVIEFAGEEKDNCFA